MRVARRVGYGLVITGLVVLGFVPYALFATRLAAEGAQSSLREYLPVLSGGTGARSPGGSAWSGSRPRRSFPGRRAFQPGLRSRR